MKLRILLNLICLVAGAVALRADEQPEALRLVQTIKIPNSAIFDHVAVDRVHNRAYVCASSNRAIEVVDLKEGKWLRTISGVGKPANIMYHPKLDRVVYSVDSGHFRFLNPNTFEVETEITLAGDADCMRWDPVADAIYVVNGGSAISEECVRLTSIDLKSRKVVNELNIPGDKLEFLTMETKGPRLFVNNVDTSKVTVVDRVQNKIIANWDLPAKTPYPQAFNEKQKRLFVITRDPALFVVLDTDTGKVVAQLPVAAGCDDLAYDVVLKRFYMSGIDGVVDVVQQKDADTYVHFAQIKTRIAARTSTFVQEQGRLYVPLPVKEAGQESALLVYETIR